MKKELYKKAVQDFENGLDKIWDRDMITDDGFRMFSDPHGSIRRLFRKIMRRHFNPN